jgi:MFS transporter, MHS family, shikimate and dehydroshikimate transport protein
MTIQSTAVPSVTKDRAREARKVAVSGAVGTTIEFYDFALYGLAAVLVFGPQFFPNGDPVVAQLGALATFAAGFIVRPLGAVIAGHFGDRIGRKRVLIWSFMLMGASTLLIAFLPTYAQVGLLAPLLLVALRLIQGLAAGAEWGGAALMAVEHAPADKKGLYGAAPAFGIALGTVLAYLVMVIVNAVAKEAFADGGWRIAFAVSIVLIAVGMIVRRTITESPLFQEAMEKEQSRPPGIPIVAVLRKHPGKVLLGITWVASTASFGYIVQPYSVGFAAAEYGFTQSLLLWAVIAGSIMKLVTVFLAGSWLDRFPRRSVLVGIALVQVVSVAAFFPLLATGSALLAVIAFTVGLGTVGLVNATIGSFLANLFPTEVAYTGLSLTYNLSYTIGGIAPLAAASIVAATGGILWMAAALMALAVLALGTALTRSKRAI